MPHRKLTRMQKQALNMFGIACFMTWLMNRDGFTPLRLLPAAICAVMALVAWIVGTPRQRA